MFTARIVRSLLAFASFSQIAHATCTRAQTAAKEVDIYDRAGLVQMVDLERGRAMIKQMLIMQITGLTSGPNVDYDKVCAMYDAILAQGILR